MELQKLIDGLKAHRSGAASYESVDEAIRIFEAMRDVDGEKVVNGLECCLHNDHKNCHYNRDDIKDTVCTTEMMSDALALIRQQQERIKELEAAQTAKWMTEEYIKCCLQIGEVVWLEWRRENKINPAIYYRLVNNGGDEAAEFHVLDGFIGARLACYGTEWRCWTQRPTDEQRKAVKWDE